MHMRSKRTLVGAAFACLVGFGIVSGSSAADGVAPAGNDLPGDSSVPFWPHETGVLVGTSETYVDVRADGSYFDPSIGRRVLAR
jgi:hypothetical protein